MVLSQKSSIIILAGAALIILKQARAGRFAVSWNKFLWISSFTMGLLLRQLLAGTNKKFITNHAQVGNKGEEYDYIVVGGGMSLSHSTLSAF